MERRLAFMAGRSRKMDRIDPKSLSFAEVRKVLSELESAEREARFSTLFRELIVEPLLAAARNKGVDVAEFPSLMGRPAVADAQHVLRTPPSEPSKVKVERGGH